MSNSSACLYAGDSRHVLHDPTQGKGPFESHLSGTFVMKELRFPWLHWHSKAAPVLPPVLPREPFVGHPWVTGDSPQKATSARSRSPSRGSSAGPGTGSTGCRPTAGGWRGRSWLRPRPRPRAARTRVRGSLGSWRGPVLLRRRAECLLRRGGQTTAHPGGFRRLPPARGVPSRERAQDADLRDAVAVRHDRRAAHRAGDATRRNCHGGVTVSFLLRFDTPARLPEPDTDRDAWSKRVGAVVSQLGGTFPQFSTRRSPIRARTR